MIERKLDKVHVDVLENPDGSLTFQGAVFEYERRVLENGEHVGNLPSEVVSVTPEEASRVLGTTAGAHVAKLAEVEQILADERAQWERKELDYKALVSATETRANVAEQACEVLKSAHDALRKTVMPVQ